MTERDHSMEELEMSLKRAFVDGKADFIIVDGHDLRSKFKRQVLAYAEEKGFLSRGDDIDEDKNFGEEGIGQYLAYTYKLTDKGKEHFGIPIYRESI